MSWKDARPLKRPGNAVPPAPDDRAARDVLSFQENLSTRGKRRPVRASISVDLPAPFGPMMPCRIPLFAILKLTPSSALNAP
jgi:hypothetical protein